MHSPSRASSPKSPPAASDNDLNSRFPPREHEGHTGCVYGIAITDDINGKKMAYVGLTDDFEERARHHKRKTMPKIREQNPGAKVTMVKLHEDIPYGAQLSIMEGYYMEWHDTLKAKGTSVGKKEDGNLHRWNHNRAVRKEKKEYISDKDATDIMLFHVNQQEQNELRSAPDLRLNRPEELATPKLRILLQNHLKEIESLGPEAFNLMFEEGMLKADTREPPSHPSLPMSPTSQSPHIRTITTSSRLFTRMIRSKEAHHHVHVR